LLIFLMKLLKGQEKPPLVVMTQAAWLRKGARTRQPPTAQTHKKTISVG
jgi:transposase-like protein